MARIPKPTALKVLNGVERKDRINKNEPKPGDPSLIPPVWLTDEGVKLWNKYALVFKNLNVFKQTDEMSFASWCQEMGRYIELQVIINKKNNYLTGDTEDKFITDNTRKGIKPIPEMAMARECLKNARALAIEFGMTPSSRSGLSIPDGSGELLRMNTMKKQEN